MRRSLVGEHRPGVCNTPGDEPHHDISLAIDGRVGAGLVVAAKRERAGRSVFLPGGWLALKAPNLPVEAWKAPLYRLTPGGASPLSALLALQPVASLFSDAWRRVQDGDEPRLERM